MKFGFEVPVRNDASAQSIRDFAVTAEGLGFSSLWVGDHIVIPDEIASRYPMPHRYDDSLTDLFPDPGFFEACTALGYLAGCTSTISLGIGVLVVPMRNPVFLAKQLATLSVVSQGRILAGIGLGWMKEEFDALNEPFDHLGARTDEYVAIMRKLWRATGPVGYEGRFYSFRPVRFKPQPIDKGMPLWVGGHSEAALARTAKYGAGWFAVELEPDEVRASVRRLGELARQAGREEPIEIACGTRLPLSGHNVDAAIQRVRDYQEAGVDHLILYFTTKRSASENLERMKRVADEVVPAIAR